MTEYPYEPPEREFSDTLLVQLASWRVRVEPDPLGPVNKVVKLLHGERLVAAVVTQVPAGASVRLVRDEGGWTMNEVFALRQRIWDARDRGEEPEYPPHRPPGWRVEIDGRTVLAVTDAELAPPRPPAPRIALWRRMRTALLTQARADADWIAGRLGYHRDDEYGWDE